MFKKILATSVLFIGSVSNIFAGSFYVGPALNFESLQAGNARYEGLRPMLMGGYGFWYRDWFFLAIEAFGGGRALRINNVPRNGISLKTSYVYGGSFIIGAPLDEELMLYGRLGALTAKFKSLDATRSGGEVGVGLQVKVNDCWSIRGEYDYVRYRSISGLGLVKSGQINLGANYHFSF